MIRERDRITWNAGTKIVKDVIDAHHGEITVESELGVGTSFHITLPVGWA